MPDEPGANEHERLVQALRESPSGTALLARVTALDIRVVVAPRGLGIEGEFIPDDKRIVLSDALSDSARIAVFVHELRHAEQWASGVLKRLKRAPPLDGIVGARATEADAEAMSHLVCWELRSFDPAPWAYLSEHAANDDIAAAFTQAAAMPTDDAPSDRWRLEALRAAFCAYAAKDDRLRGCDWHHLQNCVHGQALLGRWLRRHWSERFARRVPCARPVLVWARGVAIRWATARRSVVDELARLPTGAEPYLDGKGMREATRPDRRGPAQYALHILEVSVYDRPVSRLRVNDPRRLARDRLSKLAAAAEPVLSVVEEYASDLKTELKAMVRAHARGKGLRAAKAGAAWREFSAALETARRAVDKGYWRGAEADPRRGALNTAIEAAADDAEGLRLMGERMPGTRF